MKWFVDETRIQSSSQRDEHVRNQQFQTVSMKEMWCPLIWEDEHLPVLLSSECVLFRVTPQNDVIINKNMGKVSLRLPLMNILYYTEHPCKTNKSLVFKE